MRGADLLLVAAAYGLAPALAAQHRPTGTIAVGQTMHGRLKTSDEIGRAHV